MRLVDLLRMLSLAGIWGASFLFMRIIAPVLGTIPTAFFRVSIAATGLVVCLRASPEMILSRVGRDTNRPLLQTDDKLGRIRELLGKRQHLYDAIPHQFETDGKTDEQVAEEILSLFLGPA